MEPLSDDDGSYELIDADEADYRVMDFEENASAAKSNRRNMKENLGVRTDSKDSTNYHSDSSFEFVAPEEFYDNVTEKNSSESCEEQESDTDSSVFDVEIDDDKSKDVLFQDVPYDAVFNFPANIKPRCEMTLNDVVQDHVLKFLPAKSLLRFRTVSKEWDKCIASPFFAHTQSHQFQRISGFFHSSLAACNFISLDRPAYGVPSRTLKFIPRAIVIRSSCNGLLLCQEQYGEKRYYIVNPTKKEWKCLPEPQYYHGENSKCVLVFEPSSLNFEAHFQVICVIDLPLFEGPIKFFEIYDSATKSWNLSTVDCVELGDSVIREDGFYSNGIVYWQTYGDELLAFDFKNEICGVQPLPVRTKCIGLFDGEMCYMRGPYETTSKNLVVEIYRANLVLKKIIQLGGGSASGMNDFQILSPFGKDVAEIVLQEMMATHSRYEENMKRHYVTADYKGQFFPYVNSLTSLKFH